MNCHRFTLGCKGKNVGEIRLFYTREYEVGHNMQKMIRSILYVLFILFLAISFGLVVFIIYGLIVYWLLPEEVIRHSRGIELTFYILALIPPLIYCWREHLRFNKAGNKVNSYIYRIAGIIYFVGGFVFLLIFTGFALLRS